LREDVLRSLKSRAPLRSPESEQDADDEDDEGISTLDKRARKEAEARPLPVDGYAYDEELVREQLARNYAFFGEEGMRKLRGASVVIVGCGGVGSWAAVMLARS
jgi:tRNA threonylcarbamoyladenosine dehydratase